MPVHQKNQNKKDPKTLLLAFYQIAFRDHHLILEKYNEERRRGFIDFKPNFEVKLKSNIVKYTEFYLIFTLSHKNFLRNSCLPNILRNEFSKHLPPFLNHQFIQLNVFYYKNLKIQNIYLINI